MRIARAITGAIMTVGAVVGGVIIGVVALRVADEGLDERKHVDHSSFTIDGTNGDD